LEDIRAFLREKGVPDEDADAAHADGSLHLLVLEHLIVPDPPRYTPVQVAELAGVPLEQVRQYWRSLGFPDVSDDTVAFADYDVEAVRTLTSLMQYRMVDPQVAVQMARVIGSSMARIAEAEITASPLLTGHDDDIERAHLLVSTADATIPSLARLLEYSWRRHLQAAARRATLWRASAEAPGSAELSVGFADLVGFTALSQQLSAPALADVVNRFEEVAFDVVVRGGGRVVKMIGDEAMFVVTDPGHAVHIGLDLAEAYADEESLSDVRVGIAHGQVLPREGDYYGPTVNLASRIVNIARPGSVVVSNAVHDELADTDPTLKWRPLRPRYLKEIGRVGLWVVKPADESTSKRRRGAGVFDLIPERQRAQLEQLRERLQP
jgi:adenylate cyclase